MTKPTKPDTESKNELPQIGDVTKSFGSFEDSVVENVLANKPHLTKEEVREMLRYFS